MSHHSDSGALAERVASIQSSPAALQDESRRHSHLMRQLTRWQLGGARVAPDVRDLEPPHPDRQCSDRMRPVIRRLAATVLLMGTGGLLTACGSSHPAATTSAHGASMEARPARASGASRSTERLRTKAQAVAFARAVNLRASDVPGFRISSEHENEHKTAAEQRLEHEMLGCLGAPSPKEERAKELAEVKSPELKFEHGLADETVDSSVSVARTAVTVAKELATINSAHARACVSHYFNLLFKGKAFHSAHIGPVSIASGTPPAPGATGSFGWRISAAISTTINTHSIAIPFYFDILGFVDGQAQVSLMSSGVIKPFPAATEQRLFLLLLERAKAHGA
jgi:hypothetical protein